MYPSIDQTIESTGDGEFLLRVYPCFYARIGLCALALSTALAAILFIIKTCSADSVSEELVQCSPSMIRLVGLVPLGFLLTLLHYRFNNRYLLDDTNISRQEGRLSLCFRNPSIRYADIKGITVYQSFWGRILNFGSLELGTSANEGNELIIDQVKAPYYLAELIEALRRKNLKLDD